jgi:hypothetical protein
MNLLRISVGASCVHQKGLRVTAKAKVTNCFFYERNILENS